MSQRDSSLFSCFMANVTPLQNKNDGIHMNSLYEAEKYVISNETIIKTSLRLLRMFPALIENVAFDDLWLILLPWLKRQRYDDNGVYKDETHNINYLTSSSVSRMNIVVCCESNNSMDVQFTDIILRALAPCLSVHTTAQRHLDIDDFLRNAGGLIFMMTPSSIRDKKCLDLLKTAISNDIPVITIRDNLCDLPDLSQAIYQQNVKVRITDNHTDSSSFHLPHLIRQNTNITLARIIQKQYEEAILYSQDNHSKCINTLYKRLGLSELNVSFPTERNEDEKHLNLTDIKLPQISTMSTLQVVGSSLVSRPTSSVELYNTDHKEAVINKVLTTLPKSGYNRGKAGNGLGHRTLQRRRSRCALPPVSLKPNSVVSNGDLGAKSTSFNGLPRSLSPNSNPPPVYEGSAQSDPEEERLSLLNKRGTYDTSFLVFKSPGAKPELVRYPFRSNRRESIMFNSFDDESELSIPFDVPCPTDLETESLSSSPESK